MPGMTPLRPDDVHSARAWAAFVADDAAAAAPPSLEARVLRAAQAALAQKQRADAERARRRWFAGISAIAASLLAAAAWSLAPGGLTASRAMAPGGRVSRRDDSGVVRGGRHSGVERGRRRRAAGASRADDQHRGRPRARDAAGAARVAAAVRSARRRRPGPGARGAAGQVVRRAVVEPVAVARTHAAPIAPPPAHEATAAPSSPARSPARRRRRGRCGPSRSSIPTRSRPRRRHRCIASTTPRRRLRRAEDPPAPPK